MKFSKVIKLLNIPDEIINDVGNKIDTRHIQIDPESKVGLELNGELLNNDSFTNVIEFLKTTKDSGTYNVVKDGMILLTVSI